MPPLWKCVINAGVLLALFCAFVTPCAGAPSWVCYATRSASRVVPCDDTAFAVSFCPPLISCSHPTRPRHVRCESDGSPVPESYCLSAPATSPKPLTAVVCPNDCPASFSWVTIPAPACHTPIQGSYCAASRHISVVCEASSKVDSLRWVADDSRCAQVGSKPSSAPVACTEGLVSCGEHGTCASNPVIFDGRVVPGVTEGVCRCDEGYIGDTCSVKMPKITEMTALLSKDNAYLAISWTFSGAVKSDIALRFFGVSDASPRRHVATAPSLAAGSITVPSDLLVTHFPNQIVTITAEPDPSSTSPVASLAVPVACLAPSGACLNGGACDPSTGTCSCKGEYSGSRCEVSPCATKGCISGQSNCTVSEEGTAQCNCMEQDGFEPFFDPSDEICKKPLYCDNYCINGGKSTSGSILSGTNVYSILCDDCECPNKWTGSQCEKCGLEGTCGLNGTPSADCSVCVCKPGFSGDACESREVSAQLLFSGETAAWYSSASKEAKAMWISDLESSSQSLAKDITLTTKAEAKAVIDKDCVSHVRVTVRFHRVSNRREYATDNSDSSFQALGSGTPARTHEGDDAPIAAALNNLKESFLAGSLSLVPAFKGLNIDAGLGLTDPMCERAGGTAGGGVQCPEGLGAGGTESMTVFEVHSKPLSCALISSVVWILTAVGLFAVVFYAWCWRTASHTGGRPSGGEWASSTIRKPKGKSNRVFSGHHETEASNHIYQPVPMFYQRAKASIVHHIENLEV